ncbi:Succinate dehydrogenase cytochrome b subunit [Serinicoccus hydrothermalis]|uniref:Succinate dehydrogenase cytochrome b subunit n=1 Tax=Serinicoccus hydrothermalis TaxID=1758689 RepID=A0A1B1NBG6_9MICO|nr:succinate dehydrogenase cytochrome b subunit [Serinicoccus hydrothermalis]ANS78763.1 Succinate dehydrogenase cytochrome b subunit [Serinicoccus hydrothermalis]
MATSTAPERTARKGPPSILLKTVVAVTGLFFVFFVLFHMYGNLQILVGTEAFDEYAHHLRTFGEPMLPEKSFLWVFRILLLASLVGHVWATMSLWRRAGAARTTRYAGKKKTSYGGFYAKAMRWGGLALLAFVVFHIMHFTTQTITIDGAYASPAERVITSFQVWWVVGIYALAMVFLGMHLLHGVWGAAMTLGLNTSLKRAEQIRFVSILLATIIVVGFLVPPFAILFGFIE